MTNSSIMDLHGLVQWAQRNGILINGIKPSQIPGRGTGMVATRPLEESETILDVPAHLIRCHATLPPSNTPIHALLAADLLQRPSPPFLLPTMSPSHMPLLWPPSLRALLPSRAQAMLRLQEDKFHRQAALFDLPRDDYANAWLTVNSRSFLNETPQTATYPWEDRLALVPVADLFNHDARPGCRVHVSPQGGYSVSTTAARREGEELCVSYGRQGTDFLLVEYGFVPDENPFDEVLLDDAPSLEGTEACPLVLTQRTRELVKTLMKGGEDEKACFLRLLHELRDHVDEILRRVERVEGYEAQKDLLRRRWTQIGSAVNGAIEK